MPRNIKGKIVLVPFTFDDLSAIKDRPALCLSRVIGPYRQVVVAYISSKVPISPLPSDLILGATLADFAQTGLQVSSVIRLHQVTTIRAEMMVRELGELSPELEQQVSEKLRALLGL